MSEWGVVEAVAIKVLISITINCNILYIAACSQVALLFGLVTYYFMYPPYIMIIER